ncbi:uncharacterized protein SOCEGT47_003680 [Sorangium cellulosum]|uniref:Uncharacterized protein n=1 Tax=Sorangium cellulosum TaxID=56 RepID=A0A4P2PTJ6_SORCE|nr:hypothetical protein [Sorangium cellulosum]AUX19914.1 uncharacterized protein SOCEGT47_003680 [Sorangium cellulosum]
MLSDIAVGGELEWSGPWGKLRLPDGFSGRALVVATDTGITAALGIARGAAAAGAQRLDLLWLVESEAYFVPERFVRDRLPAAVHPSIAAGFPRSDTPSGRRAPLRSPPSGSPRAPTTPSSARATAPSSTRPATGWSRSARRRAACSSRASSTTP